VNWVLDADIRGFFDNLSHEWTTKFIEHRVAGRRILRLIQKWLKAGVSEDGQWSETKLGTPQGAVVSPLIANVYLHYLFDLWADVWRRKVAKGDVIVVRYADDLVVGFQHRTDAERFLREFRERLAKFGLELHPDKTRLIEFGGSPFETGSSGRGKTRDLHRMADHCEEANGREAQSHQAELQRRMHERMAEVGAWLRKVVLGYYQYHAVSWEHDSVAHLQTSRLPAMAECFGLPQSARKDVLGTFDPSLEPVDSATPSSEPISRCTLLRHSSFVRAVCVNALVRICAGGDQ